MYLLIKFAGLLSKRMWWASLLSSTFFVEDLIEKWINGKEELKKKASSAFTGNVNKIETKDQWPFV